MVTRLCEIPFEKISQFTWHKDFHPELNGYAYILPSFGVTLELSMTRLNVSEMQLMHDMTFCPQCKCAFQQLKTYHYDDSLSMSMDIQASCMCLADVFQLINTVKPQWEQIQSYWND